ncbi:polyphenol oxidase family protein, partial [Candidatus Pelagibacter bacterium]|nr:polyphenol oxidase family protein [Candidatus Pelagibacter bacterium]
MQHAFFNRKGGKSLGIFKSLNCGPGSLDNKKNVLKNLQIIQKKIKTKLKKIILLKQIHSNKFHFVDKNLKLKNYNFEGDALITNKKEFPIAILTADCAPILIYDEKEKMIAAIHAGWKGAFKGIIKRTLNFMIKKGCAPK